jgi:hypothetical protein
LSYEPPGIAAAAASTIHRQREKKPAAGVRVVQIAQNTRLPHMWRKSNAKKSKKWLHAAYGRHTVLMVENAASTCRHRR